MKDKNNGLFVYKIIVINVVTCLILLLFFSLSVEIYARIKGVFKGYEFSIGFDPYSIYRGVPFDGQQDSVIVYDGNEYKNNNLGIRKSTDTSIKKNKNIFRIIIGGGSGAWGLGVSNNQTLSYFLEEKLNERYGNAKISFEVLNLAAPGYYSTHNFLRYNSFGQHLSPDMLILMDGANDWLKKETLLKKYTSFQYGKNYIWPLTDRSLLSTWMLVARNLGQYSVAFDKYYRGRIHGLLNNGKIGNDGKLYFVKLQEEKEGLDKEPIEDFETVFKKSVMKTYSTLGYMTKENGTDFIIALQPIMSMRDKEDLAPSELELYEKHKSPITKILHQKLNRFMPVEAEKIGATYIDINENIKKPEFKVLMDYCHLTPEGNNLTAEIFLREISPIIERRLAL